MLTTTYTYKDQSAKNAASLPIRVSHGELEAIDHTAANLGLNRSAFIRMAIHKYINGVSNAR
jgi:predicted DNA binding CopG/RHH family protein